jgi:hypothetical protein
MFVRCIQLFSRYSFRTLAINSSSQQSTDELCQEYGRRMKDHLVRAESKQVLNLLDELIEKHRIKPNYINYLLAMRTINHSKQRTDADRLYNLIKQDSSMMAEGRIQTGLVYMYAIALGDISYAEKVSTMIQTPHINVLTVLMTVSLFHSNYKQK